MQMSGREFSQSNTSYRYSINGQEKTPEIAPNTTTALYWEYDSRIGRRWNLDPKLNVAISPYATFENNPIWYKDPLGDEVDPKRKKGKNILVVPTKGARDEDIKSHGGKLNSAYWADYKKAKKMERKSHGKLKVIESDNAADAVIQIKGALAPDEYVKNITIDFHRSSGNFDDPQFDNGSVEAAFKDLANGYIGKESNVYLGMCWSGGNAGTTIDLNNLTQRASNWLDGATTYGHKAANSALGFYFTNQFKGYIGEDYAKTADNKNGKGIHVVSYFSPVLGVLRSVEIKAKVYIENNGTIHIRSKLDLNSLPSITPVGGVPSFTPRPRTPEVIAPPVEN